jgi:hypothetical protein
MLTTGFVLMNSQMVGLDLIALAYVGSAFTVLPLALGFMPILMLLGFAPSDVQFKAMWELWKDTLKQDEDTTAVDVMDRLASLTIMTAPSDATELGGDAMRSESEGGAKPSLLRSVSVIAPKKKNGVISGSVGLSHAGSLLSSGHQKVKSAAGSLLGLKKNKKESQPQGADAAMALGGAGGFSHKAIVYLATLRKKRPATVIDDAESTEDPPRILSLDVRGATQKPPYHVVMATQAAVNAIG